MNGLLKAAVGLGLILTMTGCVVRRTQATQSDVMDLDNTSAADQPALEPLTTNTPPPAPIAPPQDEPSPAHAPRTHTIAAGDTLWNLAVRYYGDGKQAKRIQEANPGLVAERMTIGKQITIP